MLGVKALAGKALYGLGCIVTAVVLVVSGVAYYGAKTINGLGTSPVLEGGPSTGPMNILIMGIESRTYWNGTSVDHHIATILNIGTAADNNGGNAANTLILLHIFAGGQKAVGFSIPRDAYVPMVGTMGFGTSPSKIDNAYGYAMARQMGNDLTSHPDWSFAQRSLDGNYAGQRAEIETVQALTGVAVDKFVDLNLVGYYNIAEVFGGIEACVFPWPGGNTPSGYLAKNANLSDPVVGGTTGGYGSGSQVVAGIQHLSPAQSLAFVRNRHTVPGGDTGRTYRQQAVLDYVLNNLKTGGILSDAGRLQELVSSAGQYVQLPRNWNLVQFGGEISGLTPSKIALATLPTDGSETAPNGVGTVSTVDIPAIQRIVRQAFSAPPQAARGRASSVAKAPAKPSPAALLAAKGYTSGTARSASGVAPALTPQERRWAAEAKAKYGIPCVY